MKGTQGLTQKRRLAEKGRGHRKTTATKGWSGSVFNIAHPFSPASSILQLKKCTLKLKLKGVWSQNQREADPRVQAQSNSTFVLSITRLPCASDPGVYAHQLRQNHPIGPYLALLSVFQLRTIRDKIRKVLKGKKHTRGEVWIFKYKETRGKRQINLKRDQKKKMDKTPKTGKIKQPIWTSCPIISNRLTIPIFKMS